MTSLHILKSLGKRWTSDPPVERPTWSELGEDLTDYAAKLTNKSARRLPIRNSLADWIDREEQTLRDNRYDCGTYNRNAVFGYEILPIFEQHDDAWSSVAFLTDSELPLREYLKQWEKDAPSKHSSLISDILRKCSHS